LIEAPAEHREVWIVIIRSRHWGRPECAKSGHTSSAIRRWLVTEIGAPSLCRQRHHATVKAV
jgi:hypothetical protein